MVRYVQHTVGERKLWIYLPPSYKDSPEVRYPVAYVQDGGDLFNSRLNYLEHLFRQGKLAEIILVGIMPYNRNDEYTPWPAAALVAGRPDFGGGAQAYIDELADNIKPQIDALFRTKPEAANTAMIGGSLGGLVSLFAGYQRPEVFGRIGMLSASFWYEGVLEEIAARGALPEPIRFYLSVGTCEGIYKNGIQRKMVENTRRVHASWLQQDGVAARMRFVVAEGGTHDLLCMAERLPEALGWLFAQQPEQAAAEEQPFRIPGTKQWTVHAGRSGAEYRIFVYVPETPPPPGGYPVLYALDGNAVFGSLAETMRLQSRPPHGYEPGVIIGIGYPAAGPLVADRRMYDYTEPADPAKLPVRPDRSSWPAIGGAEAFLAFIEGELKPLVERHIPIDRSRQALFGHSLGGWFALYVLAQRPEAFTHYAAGSPSIWWNGSSLLARLPLSLSRHLAEQGEGADLPPVSLYIGIGSEEKPAMLAEAEHLAARLEPLRGPGFTLTYRRFEGEGHLSVLPPLFSGLLRFWLKAPAQ